LGLDYACRPTIRSAPSVHRIMKWRRMIGADPHPFAPLPKRQRRHLRFHRMEARILIGSVAGWLSRCAIALSPCS
jgi:hypothetical protein